MTPLQITFEGLPWKVKENILRYCSISDLKTVNICSKACNEYARPFLWNAVALPWETLQENDSVTDVLPRFQYTTSLHFYIDDDDVSMFYDDTGGYCRPKVVSWESVGGNFKAIIEHCNYELVDTIKLHGFMEVPGVYLICTLLPNLQHVSFKDVHTIPDTGWRLIFTLPRLKSLSFERCELRYQAIIYMIDAPCLEEIRFTSIFSLNDECLKAICSMEQLKRLAIVNCQNISPNGLLELGKLTNLDELELDQLKIDQESLSCITLHLSELTKLKVMSCTVPMESICFEVGNLKNLTELCIPGLTEVSETTINNICMLTSLVKLDLGGCLNVTGESLNYLCRSLTSLSDVSLSNCNLITSNGLRYLTMLKSLTNLNVSQCDLDDTGLSVISHVTSLQKLDISKTSNISDEGLSCLETLTSLRELNLSCCRNITDEGLVYINTLSNLEVLDISKFAHGCETCISNIGLTHIAKLKYLKKLVISGSEDVKENGFIVLANLELLEELHCHGINKDFSDHLIEDFCRVTGMKEKAQVRLPSAECRVCLVKDSRYWPRNGTCGLSWNCYCMYKNILELPFEVREKICGYLSLHELKNFAYCSRMCRESVKHILWGSIEIHWKTLEQPLPMGTLENFGFVKSLCFLLDDDDHFYRHDDLGEYRRTSEIVEWESVASAFRYILSFCDPDKLTKIILNGFMLDDGIDLIRQLHRSLKQISLTNCYGISDIGWKIIGTFPKLTNVTVKGCNLYSRRLKEVVLAPSLKEIEIRCVPSLNDVGMEIISHVSELTKLVITRNSEVTELGFIELIRLEKLEEAHFYDVALGDHALASICLCSLGLKKLYVNSCKVTDIGLMYLGNLKELTHLTMTGFSEPISLSLEHIITLYSLEQLNISGCTNLTDETMTEISKSMPRLKDLNISRCIWVTDAGVLTLKALKQLRSLNISECTLLTDVALFNIKSLTTLRFLDVSGCDDITATGIECMACLQSLHDLFMRNCKGMKDDAISHLCTLERLDFIDLTEVNQTFLTDVGLVYMSKIYSLKVVAFTWTESITKDGFLLLCGLPLLEEVIIDIDEIPDETFEEFCHISRMKEKSQYISVDINPVVLSKNSRYWPRNGKCGLRWNCTCVSKVVENY